MHTSWTYNGAGRVAEVRRWSNTWSTLTRCLYDSHGRPLRTIDIAPDGTERIAETWGMDELGRPMVVQFLPAAASAPASKYDDDEITAARYGVPAAVTATSIYDGDGLLIEVRYHDLSHSLLFTVSLTRDSDGRIVLQEERFTDLLHSGKELDEKLASAPEEDQRKFKELMDAAFDDQCFTTVSYERDANGRVLASVRRMGALDETRSTYAYDVSGNLVERVDDETSTELALDDTRVITRQEKSTCRHWRFDYVYDDRGNWTERISLFQDGGDFQRSQIERRTLTYYSG